MTETADRSAALRCYCSCRRLTQPAERGHPQSTSTNRHLSSRIISLVPVFGGLGAARLIVLHAKFLQGTHNALIAYCRPAASAGRLTSHRLSGFFGEWRPQTLAQYRASGGTFILNKEKSIAELATVITKRRAH